MLYPDPDNIESPNFYAVVDFKRPELPITADDVLVPTYPQQNDMIAIHGEGGELWFAHVLSVNEEHRTCQVHFYIRSVSNNQVFVREVLGRNAVDTLAWDSILYIASGSWDGNAWKPK